MYLNGMMNDLKRPERISKYAFLCSYEIYFYLQRNNTVKDKKNSISIFHFF